MTMAETKPEHVTRCNSRHPFSDCRCIRPLGHWGKCWGKWERMMRAVWYFTADGEPRHWTYEDLKR